MGGGGGEVGPTFRSPSSLTSGFGAQTLRWTSTTANLRSLNTITPGVPKYAPGVPKYERILIYTPT